MDLRKLPTIPSDRLDDLHGLDQVQAADLILFMAGNQFMAMEALIAAFQSEHPDIQRIYYETLPPGLELKQILAGGAVFRGQVLDIQPDVYASVSESAMHQLEDSGHIAKGTYLPYLRNRLTLLVREGNPAGIESVSDLAKDEVRISQPDPENEDIGWHIIEMYRKVGGDDLVNRIMADKLRAGTTIMTTVHHRETPQRLMDNTVDVGPVWATEAIHARSRGLPLEAVEPGASVDGRGDITYYITRLKAAPNPGNAERFIQFIRSETAGNIYERFGFIPHSLSL